MPKTHLNCILSKDVSESRVSFFAVGKGGPANTTIEPIPFSLKEVEGACSSAAFYCILALPEDEYDEALEVQLDGGIGFTVETSTHSYKIKYPLTPKDMQSCRKEFFEYCATRASEQDNTYTVSLAIDQIFSGMFPSLGERTKM